MNALLLLRALKGAPLSCILALAFLHRPVGIAALMDATGYNSRNTIAAALRVLEQNGFACHVSRRDSWQLTDMGHQLPLWPPELGAANAQKMSIEPLTTTTTIYEELSANAQSSSSSTPNAQKMSIAANLQALHEAGIRGKKAEQLAALAWVTPDYVKAHVEALPHDDLGLAIYRMQSGDDAPADPNNSRRYLSPGVQH